MITKILFILTINFAVPMLRAQLWVNKGQVFYSGQLTQVRVEGSFENDSSAISVMNGILVVDSSLINRSSSIQRGSGEYDIYGDWQNSAHFIRDTGFVHFKGSGQYIQGDSATGFYNLAMEGSGRKCMKVNASVFHILWLTHLELAIGDDTLFVKNPVSASIIADTLFGAEGFVSTLDSGCLVRATSSTGNYYFPLGSVSGTPRFRPCIISPGDSSSDVFGCSFQNKKPDLGGYFIADKDSNVCKVNPFFYHNISRLSGSSSAGLKIATLESVDGAFNQVGNWKTPENKWTNTMGGASGKLNSYQAVERPDWNNFADMAYALIGFSPVADSILGPSVLCKGEKETFSALTSDPGTCIYRWLSPSGVFLGDSSSSRVNIIFYSQGIVQVSLSIADTASGCISATVTRRVRVSPGPEPGFSLHYPDLFANTPVSIKDSSKGAVSWKYDFGNGTGSVLQNPQTVYETPGDYTIRQLVTDTSGCSDTSSKTLDITCSLKIPNVFTPNDDGKNDVFLIQGMCLSEFTLEIFDRWGLLVYRGNQESSAWDGHTPSGQQCSAGTYFYSLETKVEESTEKRNGEVTLLR